MKGTFFIVWLIVTKRIFKINAIQISINILILEKVKHCITSTKWTWSMLLNGRSSKCPVWPCVPISPHNGYETSKIEDYEQEVCHNSIKQSYHFFISLELKSFHPFPLSDFDWQMEGLHQQVALSHLNWYDPYWDRKTLSSMMALCIHCEIRK